jgi:predicted DNA-binding transcriptional regulator AlpA
MAEKLSGAGAASPIEPRRVLRPSQTAELVGMHEYSLWRLERAGHFPKRFKLNPVGHKFGAVGHDYAEVMAWIEGRRASRGDAG